MIRQSEETVSASALPHERYGFDNLMLEDPIQTAEQVAMVDQVSGGRFIYGAGGRTRGSAARREQFFEYLEVMKQLWTEDHFSGFEGKYYNYPAFYEPYLAIPKPYQKPYPPMLLPVDSQESFVANGRPRLSNRHRGGKLSPQPQGVGGPEGGRESLPAGPGRTQDTRATRLPWSAFPPWWPAPKKRPPAGPRTS